MAYSQAWLENPLAIRGILVEATVYDIVAATDKVIYLSNIGYMSTDASVSYLPYLVGGVQLTESLSIDGSTILSFGDLEISNPIGDLDTWLDSTKYIWVNRPIQVYLGDPSWQCTNLAAIHTDFELVFDGLIADIDSRSRTTLNIKVRDKLERLNAPITENKIGIYGTWGGIPSGEDPPVKDTIKPLIFGEVHNISPILIDPSQLEYMFNDGDTESIIEIRDNGVPITTFTPTLTAGTFKLTKSLAGTCTLSAQGVKKTIDLSTGTISSAYTNNIAKLIAIICTQYGKATTKLSVSELDLTNLSAFSSNTQPVGTFIADRANILEVCQSLAGSIGAQLFITRKGKLQLLRIGVPTSDASVDITDRDIIFNSFDISNKTNVVAATKIGYCKNWTVQSGLTTGIPTQHKKMFDSELEWYSKTVVDSTIKSLYKLEGDPEQKDTSLLKGTDALAEATRLNDFFKVPRIVYSFTGSAKLLSLKLGQPVTLYHNRYGLSSGKSGQVVSLSPDWMKSTIKVEVLV